ncbi:MAG: trimeric intracellular cation channel family protein, partial [Burkholderiaceae bacterium]
MNQLQLLQLLEFIGVVAFALSGIMEGERKKVDPVGVFVLAFITAFGGGTIRDLLLDRRPFYWVQEESYVLVVFAMTLAAPLVLRVMHKHFPFWLFLLADAVGLALFSVAGTAMAIEAGLPAFSATMVGVVTGVFGGLLRDVFLNEIPMVLKDGKPYATAAFVGCWTYLALVWLDLGEASSLWIAAVVTVLVRMLAWRRDWR